MLHRDVYRNLISVTISLIDINSRLEILKDSSVLGNDSMSIGKFLDFLYRRIAERMIFNLCALEELVD